jgi:hypothetical protein
MRLERYDSPFAKRQAMSGSSQIAVRARRCVPYLVLGLCLIVYLYPFMRFLFKGTDEGTLVYGAVRVTQGQVPFRDLS